MYEGVWTEVMHIYRTGATVFSFVEQGFTFAALIDFFVFMYVGSVRAR
jgi:hypothetical protein